MLSNVIQNEAAKLFRQPSIDSIAPTPLRIASAHAQANGVAQLDADETAFILRTLTEEFGGEVLSSIFFRRLMPYLSPYELQSDKRLYEILRTLAGCGALTLENLGCGESIARIQPIGVDLAYNLPNPNLTGRK